MEPTLRANSPTVVSSSMSPFCATCDITRCSRTRNTTRSISSLLRPSRCGYLGGQHRAALMMVVAVALADVVQQQREEHQRQMNQLARDLGEQRIGILEFAGAQLLELAHRDQRMTIDGIDVVEVVQHARVEIAELGNDRAEHARPMHRFQRLGDALARRKNRHQRLADARVVAHRRRRSAKIVAHQLVGAARKAHALRLAIGINRHQVERIALEQIGIGDAQQIA